MMTIHFEVTTSDDLLYMLRGHAMAMLNVILPYHVRHVCNAEYKFTIVKVRYEKAYCVKGSVFAMLDVFFSL